MASATVTAALLLTPVEVGLNCTAKLHAVPAGIWLPPSAQAGVAPFATEVRVYWPASVPVNAMLEMLSESVPLFVSVKFDVALAPLMFCTPKSFVGGVNVTAGAVPLPLNASDCDALPGTSSVTVIAALFFCPVEVGLNCTPTLQALLMASWLPPSGQAGVAPFATEVRMYCPESVPEVVIPVMFSTSVPLLVTVTFVLVLVVFTRWLKAGTGFGANVTAGAMPVPCSRTVADGVTSDVMTTVADSAAPGKTVGLNATVNVQFPPLAPNWPPVAKLHGAGPPGVRMKSVKFGLV